MDTTQPSAQPASIDDIDADFSPDDEAMLPFANVGTTAMYGAMALGALGLAAAATWYCLSAKSIPDTARPDAAQQPAYEVNK